MPRPQKSGMDYFSHDTDASADEKIEALRSIYGNDGYAFFFILLERIYRTPNFELDVSDAETRQILARKILVDEKKFSDMIGTAIKFGCFDRKKYEKNGVLTSDGIQKRAQVVVEKRLKMQKKYQDLQQRVSDAETREETEQKHGRNAAESTQRKEKESKEKKSKYIYTEIDMSLAQLLLSLIRKNLPDFKEPDLEKWAEEIGRTIRIDQRTPEQVKWLMQWAQQDTFWKSNILSATKFREKFDTLVAHAKRGVEKQTGKGLKISSISE